MLGLTNMPLKKVGHEIYDITEKVYTKRDPQWLHNEILKIQ